MLPFIPASANYIQQHVRQHCLDNSNKSGQHTCQYKSCAMRYYSSRAELLTHVTHSHLTRLQTPCPIAGCYGTFIRASQLEDHLSSSHPTEFNSHSGDLTAHPGCFKRSRHPVKPGQRLGLIELVRGTQPIRDILPLPIRQGSRSIFPSSSQQSTQQSYPRWRTWGYIDNLGPEYDAEKSKAGYEPPQAPAAIAETSTMAVWFKPPDDEPDLSYRLLSRPVPIPMIPVVLKPPAPTIGYEVHKRLAMGE
ncbi:hypothetical protein BC835DRAFT_1315937 [Cytidiella melzeri]|nr:hypothetical protein BC835DRAFT_1315937 [Cytidiella melzeri]